MATPSVENPPIFTIGHSNHAWEKFLELLKRHGIEVLVDTRSQPVSPYTPHFNRQPLQATVEAQGIRYVYLGEELGGRPKEDRFYDAKGHVLYSEVAQSPRFLNAVEKLERSRKQYRTALLCSEENPAVCHRKLLIGRVLAQRGIEIQHIRGDGRLETDAECEGTTLQTSLFDDEEGKEWKSLQSVLPKKTPQTSSGH